MGDRDESTIATGHAWQDDGHVRDGSAGGNGCSLFQRAKWGFQIEDAFRSLAKERGMRLA